MRRLAFLPLILLLLIPGLLLQAGCATVDPRDRAMPLTPDRPYEVMMAGPRLFTFTLSEPARVVLESWVYPGDVAFVSPRGQLLDSDGRVVAIDRFSSASDSFRIEERLPAGVWYLRVDTPHACHSPLSCLHRDYRYTVRMMLEEVE